MQEKRVEVAAGRVGDRYNDNDSDTHIDKNLFETLNKKNMTKNEIVRRLREAGINASSIDRSASAFIQDATGIRATAGWFGFRITCDTQATERRVRMVLERYYEVDISGGVWRLRTKRRLSVMASGGLFPPAPPTPPSTKSPMYLEAAEANSTVSMVSTLETAPSLEYSTDGVNWQEWQHTTAEGTHTFDTITLGAIGDRVYLRGDNPDGLADFQSNGLSLFVMTGKINCGGSLTSLVDEDGISLTELPDNCFPLLFSSLSSETPNLSILTPPTLGNVTKIGKYACMNMFMYCENLLHAVDMSKIAYIDERGCMTMYDQCSNIEETADMSALTIIGDNGCEEMYKVCTSLNSAADMPALTTIGNGGCGSMYLDCTFNMSDDGTTLNFAFPTPPITAGGTTYSTAYDIAEWMGNTNGFDGGDNN